MQQVVHSSGLIHNENEFEIANRSWKNNEYLHVTFCSVQQWSISRFGWNEAWISENE